MLSSLLVNMLQQGSKVLFGVEMILSKRNVIWYCWEVKCTLAKTYLRYAPGEKRSEMRCDISKMG